MRKIELIEKSHHEAVEWCRVCCRGIIVKDGKILISREMKTGFRVIPGGGIDPDERPEACCIREVEEETGYIVTVLEPCVAIYEYWDEAVIIQQYFICRLDGVGKQNRTESEERNDLQPEWMDLDEALAFFGSYDQQTDRVLRFTYEREFRALREAVAKIRG